MQRTISGRPVGYQMEIENLKYQNRQLNEALRVLYYERDQNDSEWCAAEIRRLAAEGFQVGEYEFHELKAKPREQREQYLEHIISRYQRIGVTTPPPMLGDPTPGPNPNNEFRPASRDEMEAALKIQERDPRIDYNAALQYARNNRFAGSGNPVMDGMGPGHFEENPDRPMVNGDDFLTPGTNGTGY